MRLRHILPLVALLAVPALAQERTVMGGFQVGLAKPTSGSDLNSNSPSVSINDWVDGKVGFVIGGHVSFNLQDGHMIRLRLEESAYSGDYSAKLGGSAAGDAKVATLGVMGDYLYHFSGKNDGFYLMGGIGFEATGLKLNDSTYGEKTQSKGAFAWNAGLGWQFTPMIGVEARYASSHPTGFDYFGTGDFDMKSDRWTVAVAFSF